MRMQCARLAVLTHPLTVFERLKQKMQYTVQNRKQSVLTAHFPFRLMKLLPSQLALRACFS
jgi:hypothetical protein